jgi:ribosomal protein S18 acetylase RimI-like enzyme
LRHLSIVRADHGDVEAIIDLITDSFQHLAVSVWLVPRRPERWAVLHGHIRIHVEHAMRYGYVHVTSDRLGVAVWLPHDRRLPPPADYDERLVKACGQWTDRFRTVDRLFATHHPRRPHHHLTYLAVHPDRRGEGMGSTLLRHHHARLDAAGIGAYLEASSSPSRDLYSRHGYRTGEIFAVPDGAPFWPMWREPYLLTERQS